MIKQSAPSNPLSLGVATYRRTSKLGDVYQGEKNKEVHQAKVQKLKIQIIKNKLKRSVLRMQRRRKIREAIIKS